MTSLSQLLERQERATQGPGTANTSTKITVVTYNIQSGRNGRLESALRAMDQMNVDLGLFTEAKLTDGIYTRYASAYNVIATEATSPHQGGVALFYRNSEHWHIESVRKYGPNVISFELVTGHRRWAVVGAYIPPADVTTLENITQAFEAFPHGRQLLLLGDLNVNLSSPRDKRGQTIATEVATLGLEDLLLHFRQRRAFRHGPNQNCDA